MNTVFPTASHLPHLADTIPSYLLVGSHEILLEKTYSLLQQKFCLQAGCGTCTICHAIRMHQYHALTWIVPEKQYTIDDLASIFSTLSFTLEAQQHHFFVLCHADLLTPVCANKLLKSMEEPPAGYHFILLAEHLELILPTIRSRCIIHAYTYQNNYASHPLFGCFTRKKILSPLEFLKEVERNKLHEYAYTQLIDAVVQYWMQQHQDALKAHDMKQISHTHTMIELFTDALLNPPMPGSTALFLKNLYLQMNH